MMKRIELSTDIINIEPHDVNKKITLYECYLLSSLFTELLHDTIPTKVKNDMYIYALLHDIKYVTKENDYNFIVSFKGVKFYADKINKTVTIYK